MTQEPVWWVTGGSGFLGRYVLPCLAERHPVVALARNPDEAPRIPGVHWVAGDLRRPETWLTEARALPLAGVLHMGAQVAHTRQNGMAAAEEQPRAMETIVALASEQRARLVFVSSSGTVGCSRREEDAPDEGAPEAWRLVARWPYYRGKILAERAALAAASRDQLPVVVLRPPMLLGPGDTLGRSTSTLRRYLGGRLPFLVRGGIHVADVRDVAAATVAACLRPEARGLYHLPGHAEGLAAFLQRCERLCGVPAPRRHVPFGVAWLAAHGAGLVAKRFRAHPWLPDPVVIEMGRHYWGLSSIRSEDGLGYRPRPVDETLRDTLSWLLSEMKATSPEGRLEG
ncbi:MAG: NAD-dependent epimerase/dehydratase family protein [Candidatus Sericytochromatia bacterium]|nr:NAD-dependent epimerase/dehydratase family protein [Candidatus Sericytochromatia bacterium]